MTLLQLIQEHCRRRGLAVPAIAVGTTDAQILQIIGLLNQLMDDLTTRKAYQACTIETTFVTVAAEDQGALSTLFPYGFQEIVWETMFDRTQRLPLFGGVSPAEWQARKAFQITGPYYQFRLRRNRFLFQPVPPAGHTIALEYMSNYFILGPDGATYKHYFSSDDDTIVVGDDGLPLAWLAWKWKSEKGLEYAEDFTAYERYVMALGSRDARPQVANMGTKNRNLEPGIFVPSGSWNVP